MKKLFFGLIISLFLASCSNGTNVVTDENNLNTGNVEKIKIVSSIVPLASIVNYIGGDVVDVSNMVPAGVSPHGFDLKPQDLISISNSDLVIYLGLEHVDGFMNKALEGKNTLVVSDGIELIKGSKHDHDEHEGENHNEEHEDEHDDHHEEEHHDDHEDEHKGEEEDDHDHGKDPHIWGNAENAIIIAEKIKNNLSLLKPESKSIFESNFEKFKTDLEKVRGDFLKESEGKNIPEFIIFHDAYNYLFKELKISSDKKIVFRANMLVDPNSVEMKELIDEIKLHSVKNAFKEPQLNGTNLDKLALDYGIKVGILDPLGKDISANGYISNYKNNLESLKSLYE